MGSVEFNEKDIVSVTPTYQDEASIGQHVEETEIQQERPVTADPLTWTKTMKWLCTFHVCFNVFVCNFYAGGMVPTLGPVTAELHVTLVKGTELFAYGTLAQGLSNIIWVPTMVKLGKRYAVIINCLLLLPCIIWGGCAQSYNSLLASRVVGTFAAGASETYGPAVIGDVWYERHFTKVMGIFAACIFISPTLAQVIMGYLTDAAGWRWCYWLTFIIAAINAIGMILTLPETTYQRELGVGVTAGDIQRQHALAQKIDPTHQSSDVEVAAAPGFSLRKNLWFRKHPHVNYKSNYFLTMVRPAIFALAPHVFWAGLLWATVVGAFVAIGVNTPILLSSPPYFFSPGAQGLFGLSSLIGCAIGGLGGGVIVDMVNERIEKRRQAANQSHKPEERLIMLVIPFILAPGGVVMYGAVMQHHLHWIAGAFGYAISSAGMAMMSSVVLSYAVDAYIPRSGEIMVFLNCCRCLVTFAFLKVMPSWTIKDGPLETYGCLTALQVFFFLLTIPVFFYGPWLREKTKAFL